MMPVPAGAACSGPVGSSCAAEQTEAVNDGGRGCGEEGECQFAWDTMR